MKPTGFIFVFKLNLGFSDAFSEKLPSGSDGPLQMGLYIRITNLLLKLLSFRL